MSGLMTGIQLDLGSHRVPGKYGCPTQARFWLGWEWRTGAPGLAVLARLGTYSRHTKYVECGFEGARLQACRKSKKDRRVAQVSPPLRDLGNTGAPLKPAFGLGGSDGRVPQVSPFLRDLGNIRDTRNTWE